MSRYTEIRSIEDQDKLMADNPGLLYFAVNQFIRTNRVCQKIDYEDMVQAGHIGFIKAAGLWREDGKANFATYAIKSIKRFLLVHITKELAIPLPKHLFQGERRNKKWENNISKAIYCKYLPNHFDRVEEKAALKHNYDDYEKLHKYLQKLSVKQRFVIMKWASGVKLVELSPQMNLSRQRVHQLKDEALEKLKKWLTN